jgi:5,5'-dehydrodivanillate O-demethylase
LIRNPNEAQGIPLPNMRRETNTEGITLEQFNDDPVLRNMLKEFRYHYGQPPEVRRAFEEAMGINGR